MIEIRHLYKSYDIPVLEDINIKISDTGITFIHGKSGCGKSTLLNILSGLDQDYTGDVFIDDVSLKDHNEFLRMNKIAYMNQTDDLIQEMRIKDQIEWFQSMSSSKVDIDEYLNYFELSDLSFSYPKDLSGGEYSLICLLKNIVLNKKYILMDEPNAKLDKKRRDLLIPLLKELSKKHSIILVSHDLDFIEHASLVLKIENKHLYLESKQDVTSFDFNEPHSFLLKHRLKLILSNLQYYKLTYGFRTVVYFLFILYILVFSTLGKSVYSQIADLINQSDTLFHVQVQGMSITYQDIERMKKEEFVDHIDYSMNLLLPPLNPKETIITTQNQSYDYQSCPVTFVYRDYDFLDKQEIRISSSLAKLLNLSVQDSMSVSTYLRKDYETQMYQEVDGIYEIYIPITTKVTDTYVVSEIYESVELEIQFSSLQVNQWIQDHIGFEDKKVLITNLIEVFVKEGYRYPEIASLFSTKYQVECVDLIEMAKNIVDYGKSTYDILRVYAWICALIGIIFVFVITLRDQTYESKQKASLVLIGVNKKKVFFIHMIQNLIPFFVALSLSLWIYPRIVPVLNCYFYQQKLFYTPFESIQTFLKVDISKIQILEFDIMSWMTLGIILFGLIGLIKWILSIRKAR